jgi:transcriptional regulator GlxA family with amidase domain
MHTVAVVATEGLIPLDFAIPCQIFGADYSDLHDPWYRLVVVAAAESRRVRTDSGLVVETTHGLRALSRADTIVVPGSTTVDRPPPELLRALARAHRRGARIASICVGAFVLAEAGLLDGRRATTHWRDARQLQASYPRVDVDASVLYIDEGDILTSAGIAAGIDLCLHIVARDLGTSVAAAVARRLVMPLHRSGGQAQYIEQPIEPAASDIVTWAAEHVADGLTVDDLARHAAVSPRTLTRKFRATTGLPPGEWLQRERLRRAQLLLESTDLPIERVARDAGYDSSVTMRAQFALHLQTSPRAYRNAFRAEARGGAVSGARATRHP